MQIQHQELACRSVQPVKPAIVCVNPMLSACAHTYGDVR